MIYAILPSVLDRLTVSGPGTCDRKPCAMAQLQESVRRNLEQLLNSRAMQSDRCAGSTLLEPSVANYGVRQSCAQHLASATGTNTLVQQMEQAIARFEPRLCNVSIKTLQTGSMQRYRIEATLLVNPAPQHIAFDSTLEAATGALCISGARP